MNVKYYDEYGEFLCAAKQDAIPRQNELVFIDGNDWYVKQVTWFPTMEEAVTISLVPELARERKVAPVLESNVHYNDIAKLKKELQESAKDVSSLKRQFSSLKQMHNYNERKDKNESR